MTIPTGCTVKHYVWIASKDRAKVLQKKLREIGTVIIIEPSNPYGYDLYEVKNY